MNGNVFVLIELSRVFIEEDGIIVIVIFKVTQKHNVNLLIN